MSTTIITTNVPECVRNWAICHDRILNMTRTLHSLERGEPQGYIMFMKLRSEGRSRLTAAETAYKRRRLARRIHLYARLQERIEMSSRKAPSYFLMNSDEIMALIGKTLKWFERDSCVATFETITHAAPDGSGIYGSVFPGQKIEPLDLLCRGYGTAAAHTSHTTYTTRKSRAMRNRR